MVEAPFFGVLATECGFLSPRGKHNASGTESITYSSPHLATEDAVQGHAELSSWCQTVSPTKL